MDSTTAMVADFFFFLPNKPEGCNILIGLQGDKGVY